MKSVLTALIISMLLYSQLVFAQWMQVRPSPTQNDLVSVSFACLNLGLAVGESGTIIKTTDSGESWSPKPSGTTNFLLSVSMISQTEAWACGASGTILKTIDGGDNWLPLTSGTSNHLFSIFFLDSLNGWTAGSAGTILKTTNGGQNWIDQSIATTTLNSICFIDYNNGWVTGNNGIIYRTTNGGTNWIQQQSNTPFDIENIYFTETNIGWATGGYGTMLKSTDTGETWSNISSGFSNHIYSINFVNSQFGWAVGFEGIVLYTENGGDAWVEYDSLTNNSLHSVYFFNANIGWAVGFDGIILKTINGGGLPVELISFYANILGNRVQLNWLTATELNNKGFEIEKRILNSNEQWERIGFVPGHGTTTEPQSYSFIDKNLITGRHQYRLKQIDFDGSFTYSQIVKIDFTFDNFILFQNYPNPFNPTTKIKFTIPTSVNLSGVEEPQVNLKIYDILGNEIKILVNDNKSPGSYEIEFDASKLSSGIYFYQLKAGSSVETKKMIFIK